jgi:AcrR family transcriptional regulator
MQRPASASVRLGKREQTKARNRAIVLAAARKVFAQLGYEAATVRDIVRATDLAVGTFYQYFHDKDEVFLAVAEEAITDVRQRLRAVRRDRSHPFEERMFAAYLAFFEFVIEERSLFDVLERNLANLHANDPHERIGLAVQELREDFMPDLAAAPSYAPADIDYLSGAMIGIGLMVARQMLARATADPTEAARFCTRFTLAALTSASTLERRTA